MLAIPLIYGGPVGIETFATFLYNKGIAASTPDYGLVGAAAVLLLVLVTILVWLQGFLLRNAGRFVTLGGKATRPRLFTLGPLRWVVFAVIVGYILLAVLLPMLGLLLRAMTSFLSPLVPLWEVWSWDNMAMVLSSPSYLRSIGNTLVIAIGGGAAATFLVAMIALIVHRSEFRFAWLVDYLALYPRAVPGIIAGIGFFWAMILVPPMGWLRNSMWILVIAYTMRYIPTGFGAVSPMLLQISRDLDRSARSVGADWWTTCHQILFKLLRPALFSCFVVMSVCFLKEYASAVFLIAPGSEVIGTTLLSFWIQGDAGPVAALSVIQVALTFLFIYGARRLMGVRIYG
jgi:iron(III) transport system permease protein